jgi:hypothetical protein
VVKTLLGAISTAPADVLSIGTTALSVGIGAGLAQDHTAEQDVRQFLLRYLSQKRAVLESDFEALASFMNVLDTFAEAGWPHWIDVAIGLDTFYRE